MKKTPFQIIASIIMLLIFAAGVYLLYPTISQLVILLASGKVEFSSSVIATIGIYIIFCLAQLTMLLAAIQIYRTGRVCILKCLLYASIPSFNLLNYASYEFTFGPSLAFFLKTEFSPFSLGLNMEAHLMEVQYLLTFSNDYAGVIQVGVNIVPIIVLVLLRRWGITAAGCEK